MHFVRVQEEQRSNAELGKEPKSASSNLSSIKKSPNPKLASKVIFLSQFLLCAYGLEITAEY
jgi:hypothetical protein